MRWREHLFGLSVRTNLSDYHTVIYGHNMKNGMMFGELDAYKKADYLAAHRMSISSWRTAAGTNIASLPVNRCPLRARSTICPAIRNKRSRHCGRSSRSPMAMRQGRRLQLMQLMLPMHPARRRAEQRSKAPHPLHLYQRQPRRCALCGTLRAGGDGKVLIIFLWF